MIELMVCARSYLRVREQHIALAGKYEALLKATRRLVHAKRTSSIWLELTEEYKALAQMVERRRKA